MKNIVYVLTACGLTLAGAACSRIDANTSNTVPTTDAYEATVTSTQSAAGTTGTTRVDAAVNTGSAVPAGTMMYGARAITEVTFLTEAASSGMMEVQLGKLALDRSANSEVKKFAQMMIDHHSKANQELKTIASGMNVTLPTALLEDHQNLVDKLSKLTGKEFDAKYTEEMETAHERDIALFEVVSNGAPTTSVRAFAIRTLPTLRIHEHQADELDDKVD